MALASTNAPTSKNRAATFPSVPAAQATCCALVKTPTKFALSWFTVKQVSNEKILFGTSIGGKDYVVPAKISCFRGRNGHHYSSQNLAPSIAAALRQ
jgi:hypothetical protein